VLLVASFAATQVVSPTGALALVRGANLGGALPALVDAPPLPRGACHSATFWFEPLSSSQDFIRH
jgi:Na+/phosphate symporter